MMRNTLYALQLILSALPAMINTALGNYYYGIGFAAITVTTILLIIEGSD